MWSAGWQDNAISKTLYDRVTFHSVFFVESSTQFTVQVPILIVDDVVIWRNLESSFLRNFQQKVTDSISVDRFIDMPNSARNFSIFYHSVYICRIAVCFVNRFKALRNVLVYANVFVFRESDVAHHIAGISNIQVKIRRARLEIKR